MSGMVEPIKFSCKSFDFSKDEKLDPIIFLHGMTDSKETWDDLLQVFAAKTQRKVYAYDARNHGESDFTDVFSFDLNVSDLFHFMNSKNIRKAILVGHSMGSFTATNAALRKPERFEMIISEDMYIKALTKEVLHPIIEWMTIWGDSVRDVPRNTEESQAANCALDTLFRKLPDPVFDKESLSKVKYILKRTPNGGFDVNYNEEAILRALKKPETLLSDPNGRFEGPAFFLYGNLSPFQVGSEKEHIKHHFPNGEFIEFEGAYHDLHMIYPEKFLTTVLEIINNKS